MKKEQSISCQFTKQMSNDEYEKIYSKNIDSFYEQVNLIGYGSPFLEQVKHVTSRPC
jgi:hypothetical protein